MYNASETLAYFGSSEPQIIKVGNNTITVTLTKHSKLELPISVIQYVYKGDGGAELPVDVDFTYEGIDPYSVWELPEPDSGREQKEVWAWEVCNGEQYYYLFEGQTIEPKHGDNGKVILKEKLLTLGDVVLANHQIISYDEAIDGRTPIGVLASLQKQNSQTKIPLRVLSYKYETGLAWCNDTNLPEYSANVSEPEGIDTKPCPLTGLDSFLDFQTKNKITIDSTNIEKYPIFKAASEMHDGNLEWFIPHGWEVFGCTSDEISADMGSEDPLLNKGLNKIARDNNISGNVLTLDYSTAYWTSTLPNNTDGGNAQASKDFAWNHVAKNSTAPTTIFMAVLD